MLMKEYIRNKICSKLRDLLIKDKCEICGDVNNLELHHIYPFCKLLKECHESLNIKDKGCLEDYTNIEIKNITNWMLGVHLNIEYLTLCEKCHKKTHIESGGYIKCGKMPNWELIKAKREETRKEKLDIFINDVLEPYLEKVEGKKLFLEDQEKLSNLIIQQSNLIKTNVAVTTKVLKPSTLEKLIREELNLPYAVNNKQESRGKMRGKRYIIITKIK